MKIPFAEAFEVASFYAHFDVLNDDEVERLRLQLEFVIV